MYTCCKNYDGLRHKDIKNKGWIHWFSLYLDTHIIAWNVNFSYNVYLIQYGIFFPKKSAVKIYLGCLSMAFGHGDLISWLLHKPDVEWCKCWNYLLQKERWIDICFAKSNTISRNGGRNCARYAYVNTFWSRGLPHPGFSWLHFQYNLG
jgi:hypothetical protein